jgi:hypothetical protein
MTDLARVRAVWTGAGVVGGGVSTHYVDASIAPVDYANAIDAFYQAVMPNLPVSVSVTVQRTGEVIDDATGTFIAPWSAAGATTARTGTDGGPYAAGVGLRVVWNTNGVSGRRRARGSTFLVPLGAGQYDTAGTINNPSLANYQSAASALVAALPGSLVIWRRPRGGTGGGHNDVISAVVPDKVSWLRSRRT